MDTLLVIVAALLLFALIFAIAIVRQVLRLRFQQPAFHPIDEVDAPAAYQRLFAPAVAELRTRGFEPLVWLHVVLPFESEWPDEYMPVLRHPDGTLAMPGLLDALNAQRPISLVFASLLDDGRWIRTHNHTLHLQIALYPDDLDQDGYCDTVDDQLAWHREAVARAEANGHNVVALEVDALERAMGTNNLEGYEALRARELVESRNGTQYRLGPAMRQAWKFITGSKRKPGPQSFLPSPDVPIELQVVAYQRHDELSQRPSIQLAWLWVLTISVAATLVSFAGWFDLQTAIILIIVLALHEGGHYVAMVLSGYRNVRVFFLPFLGAATTGRVVNRTLAKELFVLLAGPVPGALVGIGMLMLPGLDAPLAHHFAVFFVAVNLINLLPFVPLDGGRVVHALVGDLHAVFSRLLGFVATVAFLLMWWYLDEPLGLLLAAVASLSLSSSTLNLELECRRAGLTETADVLSRVLAVPKMNGAKARVVTKTLLDRLDAPLPSTSERIVGMMTYGGAVLVLFGLSGSLLFVPEHESPIAEIDCTAPSLAPDLTEGPLAINGTLDSVEMADRLALEIGDAFDGWCARGPWSDVPPTEEELVARRTLNALRSALWTPEGSSEGSPEEAVRRVRESGMVVDEVIMSDLVESETLSAPIASRLGMERCTEEHLELAASSYDGNITISTRRASDPVAIQHIVEEVCARGASTLTAYPIGVMRR